MLANYDIIYDLPISEYYSAFKTANVSNFEILDFNVFYKSGSPDGTSFHFSDENASVIFNYVIKQLTKLNKTKKTIIELLDELKKRIEQYNLKVFGTTYVKKGWIYPEGQVTHNEYRIITLITYLSLIGVIPEEEYNGTKIVFRQK